MHCPPDAVDRAERDAPVTRSDPAKARLLDRPWLAAYPPGTPADIALDDADTLVDLISESFRRHQDKVAYAFMGAEITYARTEQLARSLASWFQKAGLSPGDRVAVMLPNTPQYPVAVAAILMAGLVVVNINPLYTPRELEHQLNDSGARAIVLLENFAHTLQKCIGNTAVERVVVAAMGDMLSPVKGVIVNAAVRHIKKLVPRYELPGAVRFKTAVAQGARWPFVRPTVRSDDIALLQYTGGTTGVSKGATLLHRNIVANVLQSQAWNAPVMDAIPRDEQPTTVCALPLYHIFAFTVCLMLSLRVGGKLILIPNARDLKSMLKDLRAQRFHSFPAVNTLYNAIANHPDFDQVDWRHLKICVGGGAAVQSAVARQWMEKTGCPICEGYGLSETSPSVTCNPVTVKDHLGGIGVPLPSTWVKCVDDTGSEVPPGEPGEIAIYGPQLMQGYWKRPEETSHAMTADGFFRTGDIGVMDETGYFRIVDRKKDMVLVSGFNVYPAEIEDVVGSMPGVLECAAVGIPDEKTGEAVKLVVVRRDPALTEASVREYCDSRLTRYKQPRVIEFRDDLPKSPVGKVLRRELRE
jgi:long-chain acyl-CoA synthetase